MNKVSDWFVVSPLICISYLWTSVMRTSCRLNLKIFAFFLLRQRKNLAIKAKMGIKLTLLPIVCHRERTRSENLIDHCRMHLVTLREMARFNHCVHGEVPPLESCKHVRIIILRCVIKKERVAFNLLMQSTSRI